VVAAHSSQSVLVLKLLWLSSALFVIATTIFVCLGHTHFFRSSQGGRDHYSSRGSGACLWTLSDLSRPRSLNLNSQSALLFLWPRMPSINSLLVQYWPRRLFLNYLSDYELSILLAVLLKHSRTLWNSIILGPGDDEALAFLTACSTSFQISIWYSDGLIGGMSDGSDIGSLYAIPPKLNPRSGFLKT